MRVLVIIGLLFVFRTPLIGQDVDSISDERRFAFSLNSGLLVSQTRSDLIDFLKNNNLDDEYCSFGCKKMPRGASFPVFFELEFSYQFTRSKLGLIAGAGNFASARGYREYYSDPYDFEEGNNYLRVSTGSLYLNPFFTLFSNRISVGPTVNFSRIRYFKDKKEINYFVKPGFAVGIHDLWTWQLRRQSVRFFLRYNWTPRADLRYTSRDIVDYTDEPVYEMHELKPGKAGFSSFVLGVTLPDFD